MTVELVPMDQAEAQRVTERIRAGFSDLHAYIADWDEPLCGPPADFKKIGLAAFLKLSRDPSLRGDPALMHAALGAAQWNAAHPGWRRDGASTVGNIYFIQAQNSCAIKIGFAITVEKRLAELQCGCPEELVVVGSMPGTVSDEKALHRRFERDHIRGEWFDASSELVAFIERSSR